MNYSKKSQGVDTDQDAFFDDMWDKMPSRPFNENDAAILEVIAELAKYKAQTDEGVNLGEGDAALPSDAALDKLVKASRPISVFRDAAFVRDFQALSLCAPIAGSGGSSVYTPHATSSHTHTHTALSPSLAAFIKVSAPARRSNTPPWWRGAYALDPVRAHRTPAQWRDTSDQLRVLYMHYALKGLGKPVYTFTVNLRDDVEKKARANPDPANWLQRRISRELANALGRPVTFSMVLHDTDERGWRLHVHGEFQIGPDEAEQARAALRRAGGEWRINRQHQTKTEANPDEGWPSYLVRDFWKYGRHVRKWTLIAPRPLTGARIAGNLFAVTADLKKKAAKLYGSHRRLVCRH